MSSTSTPRCSGQFIVGLDGLDVNGTTLHTAQIVQGANGPRSQPIAQVRFSKLDLLPRLLHTVASPPVAYLLLTIGLVLLVFEFYVAGVGIAGGVGALFLVLSAYGLAVLPTRPASVALILFSMLAFAIDVQTGVPRFWTGVGTAAFTGGSLLLYDGLSLSWITLLFAMGGVLLAMLAGMPTMIRTRFATPTIGREWMIGELGTAVVDVDPDGVVRVRDAQWRARHQPCDADQGRRPDPCGGGRWPAARGRARGGRCSRLPRAARAPKRGRIHRGGS